MELEQEVTTELCQSAQDHCPFQGEQVKGWPVTTLVRGLPMMEAGKVSAEFPGQYLKRN
jgi:dihydropyrimidinase/allantoinase